MKRTAFTFTELLMIVGIIGILVALIMPSINRVRELARRTSCSASLKAIGAGVHQYAQTLGNNGNLPTHTEFASPDLINTTVGLNRTFVTSSSAVSPTRGWFKLVIGQYAQLGLFGCPSDRDQMKLNYDNLVSQSMPPTADTRATAIYDFATAVNLHPIGYAVQVTKTNSNNSVAFDARGYVTTLADNSSMPIAADFNGNQMWTSLTAASAVSARDPAQPIDANSPNHRREGQNVLTLQGTVLWKTTPRCGILGDNIYSARKDPTNMFSEADNSTTGHPFDQNDSYLVP